MSSSSQNPSSPLLSLASSTTSQQDQVNNDPGVKTDEENKNKAKKRCETMYVTVDFETVNKKGDWFAYGFAVGAFPSCEILMVKSGTCLRGDADLETSQFWLANPEAVAYFSTRPPVMTVSEAEVEICGIVDEIRSKYPGAIFVSDNPAFDAKILDGILISKGMEPVSSHADGLYRKVVCTSSFEKGIRTVLKASYPHRVSDYDEYYGPKHTPVADCVTILRKYFHAMSVAKAVSEAIHNMEL